MKNIFYFTEQFFWKKNNHKLPLQRSAVLFLLVGILFVSNIFFQNCGKPPLSTVNEGSGSSILSNQMLRISFDQAYIWRDSKNQTPNDFNLKLKGFCQRDPQIKITSLSWSLATDLSQACQYPSGSCFIQDQADDLMCGPFESFAKNVSHDFDINLFDSVVSSEDVKQFLVNKQNGDSLILNLTFSAYFDIEKTHLAHIYQVKVLLPPLLLLGSNPSDVPQSTPSPSQLSPDIPELIPTESPTGAPTGTPPTETPTASLTPTPEVNTPIPQIPLPGNPPGNVNNSFPFQFYYKTGESALNTGFAGSWSSVNRKKETSINIICDQGSNDIALSGAFSETENYDSDPACSSAEYKGVRGTLENRRDSGALNKWIFKFQCFKAKVLVLCMKGT